MRRVSLDPFRASIQAGRFAVLLAAWDARSRLGVLFASWSVRLNGPSQQEVDALELAQHAVDAFAEVFMRCLDAEARAEDLAARVAEHELGPLNPTGIHEAVAELAYLARWGSIAANARMN